MEFDAQSGFRLGDRSVYPSLNRVVSGEDEHTVEGKVMDVLVALALHPDGVVSKNELLDTVWPNQAVADGVLVRAIHELRRALDDSASEPRYIENVPRVGYRLLQPPVPIGAAKEVNVPARRWHIGAAILAVATVGAVAWHFLGPQDGNSPIESVAVLPFVNMTGDMRKDYVSDGLTEEVIHLMAQQPRLHVSARTSSFSMRDTELTMAEIGERLHVDSIVEGSVRQERGTQRITVQLIHAATGAHRGSFTVDVREDDLFGAQQLLGAAIISMLHDAGADVVVELPASIKPANARAYDLYLKGRTALHLRSAESLRDARALLREAVWLDPNLAQAHAALAQLYVVARYYLGLNKDAANLNKRAAYDKALSLDPNNIDAIVVAATDAADNKNWDLAIERFNAAIRLHPSNPLAHLWYGQMLIMVGHTSEGLEHVEMALHFDPLAGSTNTVMAFAAGFFPEDERLASAARQADQFGARLAPRFLALHAFRRGDMDTFERELARSYGFLNIDPVAAQMIADTARDPSLQAGLATKLASYGTPRNNFFARELAQLGLYAEALAALLRHTDFEGSFASDVWLPEFKPMRALPGFLDLTRELGVEEYWRAYGLPDMCREPDPEPFCQHFAESSR
jgi:TolB-like protein/DNA-binding winged helix-turn-helix (wHTH) protein/Tfp pilus assembly protein PilF